MLYTLRFFSSKCSLFHNANLFGSCIIHILYTGRAKIKKKNNSGAQGLTEQNVEGLYRNRKTHTSWSEGAPFKSDTDYNTKAVKEATFQFVCLPATNSDMPW